jgi:hypothetical protein
LWGVEAEVNPDFHGCRCNTSFRKTEPIDYLLDVGLLLDCPWVSPGRTSAKFSGPDPGPRGPVHPQMALARVQH